MTDIPLYGRTSQSHLRMCSGRYFMPSAAQAASVSTATCFPHTESHVALVFAEETVARVDADVPQDSRRVSAATSSACTRQAAEHAGAAKIYLGFLCLGRGSLRPVLFTSPVEGTGSRRAGTYSRSGQCTRPFAALDRHAPLGPYQPGGAYRRKR